MPSIGMLVNPNIVDLLEWLRKFLTGRHEVLQGNKQYGKNLIIRNKIIQMNV